MTTKNDLQRYAEAMRNDLSATCMAIEQKYDLYGYSPEVVTVGLRAAVEGKDVQYAVQNYLLGLES